MSTTYNPTYPNPNDPPRNDVQTMQNNAGAIYNIWNKDHYTFDAATPGLHKHSTYIVQAAPSSAIGQVAQYGNTASGSSELFLVRDNNATPVQLTRGYPSIGSNGYTFLPGGLIMIWGSVTVPGSGVGVWRSTFNYGITLANVFSVTLGPRTTDTMEASVQAPGNSSVVVTANLGGQIVYVIVVGN
jgi:hypothetical protein